MSKVSEEYKELYHYTTLEGLLGILKTRTLWATHGRFLNDSSELVLFRDKLIELRLPIEKENRKLIEQSKKFIDQQGWLDQAARVLAAVKVDRAYAKFEEIGEFCVVSFCGKDKNSHYVNRNGLLSQWRGYGVGGGFALVFDTKKLEEIIQKEGERFSYGEMYIGNVIYSDDDEKFIKELRPKIDDIFAFMQEIDDIIERENIDPEKQEAPDGTRAFYAFTECIGRYKHHSFKEENEVRIVCLPTIHNEEFLEFAKEKGSTLEPEKERKIRAKNGNPIPYIELFNSPDIILPIEKIIVGPHKEKNERASALRVMLRNTNIEIIVSDIPYVD